ncbi:MAG TPA: GNAT family N-acetyltransferase [Gemmatimonadaceae bacterium]|nr:GNAT family N-acetyltransferase [Gemmatimonadaceae bacterium]
MNVRPARTADASSIKALIDLYVSDGTLLPRTLDFIREHIADFLVATDDEVVVGCVHVEEYAPSLAEIRSLAVDPGAQGQGIGAALVRTAEELAQRRELATLFAVSNSEQFFRGLGYAPEHVPELDRERSEVSKYKGVYARAVPPRR